MLACVFVVLCATETLSELSLANHEGRNEIIKFAEEVYANESGTAIIIHSDNAESVDEFAVSVSRLPQKLPVQMLRVDNGEASQTGAPHGYRPALTVIFLEGHLLKDVYSLLYAMEPFAVFNVRAKTLVIVPEPPTGEECLWLEDLLRAFWDFQVLRVLVVFWRGGLRVYAHNPFLGDHCIDVTGKSDLDVIFTHKIRNMHGYPLKTPYFDNILLNAIEERNENGRTYWEGRDGMFVTVVRDALNCTMEIKKLTDVVDEGLMALSHSDLPISTYTPFLVNVFDPDIIFHVMQSFTDDTMDTVYMPDSDDFMVIVPRGGERPRYFAVIMIISPGLWGMVCLTMLTMLAFKYVYRSWKGVAFSLAETLLHLISHVLEVPFPHVPALATEKLLFVLWLAYCLLGCSLFKSKLMSNLITPRYYEDMSSLRQLYESNTTILSNFFYLQHLNRTLVGEDREFLKHVRMPDRKSDVYGDSLSWMENYMGQVAFVLTKFMIYDFFAIYKFGKRTLYNKIEEVVLPAMKSYIAPRKKVYFPEIKEVMDRTIEAGIYQFWNRFHYGQKLEIVTNFYVEDVDMANFSLSIVHFQYFFVLYAIAMACNGLVLLAEIYWERRAARPPGPFVR